MKTRLHRPLGWLIVAACAGPLAARADCVDGTRDPSAAERDFHSRAIVALGAALPALPAGVEVRGTRFDFNRPPALGVMCKEDKQKEGNFDLQVRQGYYLKQSPAEYDRLLKEHTALRNQIEALEQLPPEVAAEREQLNKKRDAAYSASMKAGKERDKAAEQALVAESSAIDKQSTALRDRHLAQVAPQTEPLRKRQAEIVTLNQGQEVHVAAAMNATRLPPTTATNPVGSVGAASPNRSAGLKVHNIVWGVTGTAGPLRQALADSIDRARLLALVGKPPPARAESEAFAAKAVVPTVAQAPSVSTVAAVTDSSAQPASAAPATKPTTAVSLAAANPAPAAASASTAQPEKAKPEISKQATDAVNKLRGLFGR